MCNIAGYIGNMQAADILFDMIFRQEGYAGGYYSGISMLDEGVITTRKIVGGMELFLNTTDANLLKGNIGVIHSRSNAGGDVLWAHPFTGIKDGRVLTAYSAVGSNGPYIKRMPEFNKITQQLYDEGFTMLSATDKVESEIYPGLDNGTKMHMSDVMCQLIFKNILSGMSGEKAMAEAYKTMPGEIMGLNISVLEPDRIAYARISEALFVAFAPHGAYISSSPEGFPADAYNITLLPKNSSGYIFKDHFTSTPFTLDKTVPDITADVLAKAYNDIKDILKEEIDFYTLWRRFGPTLEGGDMYQVSAIMYQVLSALDKKGILRKNTVNVEGISPQFTAAQTRLSVKE